MRPKLQLFLRYRYLAALLVGGILYRLLLIRLFPQPYGWDQTQYGDFALNILDFHIYVDSKRPPGYPLFIAGITTLFGRENHAAWQITQSILDATGGLLMYGLGYRLFGSKRSALFGYLLYLMNPFTSAYAGVMLSESVLPFFVSLASFVGYGALLTGGLVPVALFALVLSILSQIKTSLLFICIGVFLFSLWALKKYRQKLLVFILCFVFPFFYAAAGNRIYFQEWSVTPVENEFVQNLYVSLFVKRFLSMGAYETFSPPKKVWDVWQEYGTAKTPSDRQYMAQKYLTRSLHIIKNDPLKFIQWRIEKMWYIWEKHYLFPYRVESNDYRINMLVYWGNIAFLTGGLCGFFIWMRNVQTGQRKKEKLFGLFVVIFILYLSVVHAFTTAEERYSLPAYPFFALFFGYFIHEVSIFRRVGRVRNVKNVQ